MKIQSEKRVYKTISFALVTVMFTLVLTGCTGNAASQYAIAPATLTVGDQIIKVPFVMKLDGKKVSLDEYRYYYLNNKYNMDQGEETFWDEDLDGKGSTKLKNDTLRSVKEAYAIEKLCGELDLSLTKEDQAQIDKDVETQITTLGSPKAYRDALKSIYLTDALYRKVWKISFCYEKLYAHYFGDGGAYCNTDPKVEDAAKETQYRIKLAAIIAKTADQLSVELGPEYDLIRIDTLK